MGRRGLRGLRGLRGFIGSMRSRGSKGWGSSSADVGVFTNRQRRKRHVEWFEIVKCWNELHFLIFYYFSSPTVETVGYKKYRID